MFEKNMRIPFLLDFYGEALDGHTKEIMTAYYEDDLSLSEIAEGESISRQGVRHIIKKGEEQLEFLEEKLGLAQRHNSLLAAAKRLGELKERLSRTPEIYEKEIALTDEVINTILNR